MRMRVLGLAAALCIFTSIPSYPSQAAVLDAGSITRDTATKLDWLDLSVTLGQSYDDVLADLSNPASATFGYRFATAGEVNQLFLDAGLSSPCTTSCGAAVSQAQQLLGLLTPTDGDQSYAKGLTGDVSASKQVVSFLQVTGSYVLLYNAIPDFGVQDPTVSASDVASFLVRSETPLPGTLPLLVSGLGAFGLLTWRKGRSAKTAAA